MTKILVVEDDEQIRQGLLEVLSQDGYEVSSAATGVEAIEKAKKEAYDLVITDLVMPGASGMDVLREVKSINSETQVIIITGFGTIENAVQAMGEGASDYLCKPLRIDDVRVKIKKAIEEAKLKIEEGLKADYAPLHGTLVAKFLSNPIRRGIIELLGKQGKVKFSYMKQELGIKDAPKLSFHLRALKSAGFVEQDEKKLYLLTEDGKKVVKAS